MTERLQMIATWVYSNDDVNVQTTHKDNAVSCINRAAFESRIDPMDPVTHATGCLMNIILNGQIAQPNVNVDRALAVRRRQLKQFVASWPDCYFDGCISCSLASCLTKKRNCWHISIPGFEESCSVRLFEADAHWSCFDRYDDYSTKSANRPTKNTATRVHQLDLKTPLPDRDAVLENYANKAHLNSLICMQILTDEQCLQQVIHTTD